MKRRATTACCLEPGRRRERVRVLSVCHFLPQPDRPDVGGFVVARIAAMAQLAQVTIMQPVPHCPGVRPLPRWAREAAHTVGTLRVEHAPMFYLPGVLKVLDGRWLERAVRRSLPRLGGAAAFDVLDAHFGYPDGVGCVRAGRRLGRPVFVTVRGLETDVASDPATGPQLVAALNEAAGVISVSYTLRDLLVSRGVQPEQFRVIPNAVDRGRFHPGDKGEARSALGQATAGPLVVCVGNLVALKRHHVLVEAFARVYADRPAARLVIIGGGESEPEYESRLRSIVESAGMGHVVRFAGRVPAGQVAEWLRAADVFALTTSREGCCNAVLEALASGRPVVTTPAGDNARFVDDGRNGYIVPIDDVEATAAALERALARSDWDAEGIAAGLGVGGWDQVASEALAFFSERLSE